MKEIAEALLDIGAVHLRPDRPFRWTSGILSPIYCDNRRLISHPRYRRLVAKQFAELIRNQYPQTQIIAGTATAGIPHAAWVADLLDLPMVYIRSSSKGHGLKNMIEGQYSRGQKAIVIEDLISTGKSSLEAAQGLEREGVEVLAVASIFTYHTQKARDLFLAAKIPTTSLANIDELLELAVQQRNITTQNATEIKQFLSKI